MRRVSRQLRFFRSEAWGLLLVCGILIGLVCFTDVTPCPTAGMLGIPCPSCGLSRAAMAIIKGDLRAATAHHPGIWLTLPYLGMVMGVEYLRMAGCDASARADSLRARLYGPIGGILLALLCLFWLARFAGFWGGPVPVNRWY